MNPKTNKQHRIRSSCLGVGSGSGSGLGVGSGPGLGSGLGSGPGLGVGSGGVVALVLVCKSLIYIDHVEI